MLYDIAFFIFSLFYLPVLLFKGKLHGYFLERFGVYGDTKRKALLSGNDRIWIQAVSVGEVRLSKNFVKTLKREFPRNEIVLSTITKTGNDLARKILSDEAIIIYFPLDFSWIVKRAIGLIQPKIFIMVETEIWPNLLKALKKASCPTVLINGRISDRSFGKYMMARYFLKKTLDRIDAFCMQSKIDAERIQKMGADYERVRITGNMKFDIKMAEDMRPAAAIRKELGLDPQDELFVAGSTHRGEEEIALGVFKGLSQRFPRLKLLIAPRHIERAAEIEDIVRRSGLEAGKVLVLDTIGRLNDIYSIATIVFMGGSLVRHGGHNPIEPALFGKPILFGPYTFNFKDITARFLKNSAALQVKDEGDLLERIMVLLGDTEMRAALGENAKKTVYENAGATSRNIEAIRNILDRQ